VAAVATADTRTSGLGSLVGRCRDQVIKHPALRARTLVGWTVRYYNMAAPVADHVG